MSNSAKRPSIEVLENTFHYDSETGVLTKRATGKVAGSDDGRGYLQLMVRGWRGRVHQVAYAMHHGKWAEDVIDHINGDPRDNRAANLRCITQRENMANRKAGEGSATAGGRYRAGIMCDGDRINLGIYTDRNLASAVIAFADVYLNGAVSHAESRKSVQHVLERATDAS